MKTAMFSTVGAGRVNPPRGDLWYSFLLKAVSILGPSKRNIGNVVFDLPA